MPVHAVGDGFDSLREALDWWGPHRPVTSSLTGGGAIACLERVLGERFGGFAVALPSASAALRLALRLLSSSTRTTIGTPGEDWFGAAAIVASAQAQPLDTLAEGAPHALAHVIVIDGRRRERCTASLRAQADGPISIVLDAAACGPAEYGDLADGTWDALVLSFGPGKAIDAGEGGALLLRDADLHRRAIRETQHPVRQALHGLPEPLGAGPCERIHPAAALIALHQLENQL